MSTDYEFTTAEKHSALWVKFQRYFQERLNNAIMDVAKPADIDKTNHIRGRIFELKVLLDLDKELPFIE